MEHARCAYCRNPIRGRQSGVDLARADMTFHADCWVTLHASVQKEYAERAAELGAVALVDPYQRAEMASWLPEAAIDEAVETLSEQLEHEVMADLAHADGSTVTVERRDPADDEPMAG